jgi:hypothetical protein
MIKSIQLKIKTLLAFLLWLISIAATTQVAVKTVVPATAVGNDILEVKNGQAQTIAFDLSSLPVNAMVDSSKLLLVLSNDVPLKMILVLADPSQIKPQVFNKTLDKPNKQDMSITLNVPARVFSTITNKTFSLDTKAVSNNITCSFYGATNKLLNYAPKLIIYYSLPSGPIAHWQQVRGNAQHTAQTQNLLIGSVPLNYNVQAVQNFRSIQTNLLMNNGYIYTLADADTSTKLFAIEPIGKSISNVVNDVLPALNNFKAMPIVDAFGRLYYFSENNGIVINLQDGNKKSEPINMPSSKIMVAEPNLGADGTLYVVDNAGINAYSPYPNHQLIWNARLAGNKSAVTIARNGEILYVVSYDERQLFAINTTNGAIMQAININLRNPDYNESTVLPMVDVAGNIYVPNKLMNADTLTIINPLCTSSKIITANNISPLALGSGNNVFFIKDGFVMRLVDGNDIPIAGIGDNIKIRSLVADLSNNVYALGFNNKLYTYTSANQALSQYLLEVKDEKGNRVDLTQAAMIIGPDASLYLCSSSILYAVRPNQYEADYTLTDNDNNSNRLTIRGNKVTVKDAAILNNTKHIVSANSINIGQNVTVAKTANITLEAKNGISFGNGFTVSPGAVFVCKMSY